MIQFSGRVGNEPEKRYFPDGTPVINFSAAIYTGKDQNGNYNPSVWVSVTATGALAEAWENTLKKGMTVTVLGYAKAPRTYVDPVSGEKRQAGLEVKAKEIEEGDVWRPDAQNPGQPFLPY